MQFQIYIIFFTLFCFALIFQLSIVANLMFGVVVMDLMEVN